MTTAAETNDQKSEAKPRYDQRLVSDPIPSAMPAEIRNKVDNPTGREMYRNIREKGDSAMDRFTEGFRNAGR